MQAGWDQNRKSVQAIFADLGAVVKWHAAMPSAPPLQEHSNAAKNLAKRAAEISISQR
jgi:hypothetical protein